MSEREYVVNFGDDRSTPFVRLAMAEATSHGAKLREEIVRCRDCKYLCDDGSTWGCGWHCSCLTTNDGTPPDGFCKWAERKRDE